MFAMLKASFGSLNDSEFGVLHGRPYGFTISIPRNKVMPGSPIIILHRQMDNFDFPSGWSCGGGPKVCPGCVAEMAE